jgi:hypothetical protein
MNVQDTYALRLPSPWLMSSPVYLHQPSASRGAQRSSESLLKELICSTGLAQEQAKAFDTRASNKTFLRAIEQAALRNSCQLTLPFRSCIFMLSQLPRQRGP